jgi:hypothetical protein
VNVERIDMGPGPNAEEVRFIFILFFTINLIFVPQYSPFVSGTSGTCTYTPEMNDSDGSSARLFFSGLNCSSPGSKLAEERR